MKYLLVYLIAISIVAVITCVYDKFAAKHRKQRVRESTLMWISVLGGAAVMYIAMCIIRHKTKHTKFMLGLPLVILLQTAIVVFICGGFS